MLAGRRTVLVDDRFAYGETRDIAAGVLLGRMVVTVRTWRDDARRVIFEEVLQAREEARRREHVGRS